MCVKFNIPVRGVSSFMVLMDSSASAGCWGWHMCKKDRIQKSIWITESINIKITIYVYDYCKINVK
jgi:hypothetical protein